GTGHNFLAAINESMLMPILYRFYGCTLCHGKWLVILVKRADPSRRQQIRSVLLHHKMYYYRPAWISLPTLHKWHQPIVTTIAAHSIDNLVAGSHGNDI